MSWQDVLRICIAFYIFTDFAIDMTVLTDLSSHAGTSICWGNAQAKEDVAILLLYAEGTKPQESSVASVECLAALARAGKLKDPEAVRAESRSTYELLNKLHALDDSELSSMTSTLSKSAMLYIGAGYISVSTTCKSVCQICSIKISC